MFNLNIHNTDSCFFCSTHFLTMASKLAITLARLAAKSNRNKFSKGTHCSKISASQWIQIWSKIHYPNLVSNWRGESGQVGKEIPITWTTSDFRLNERDELNHFESKGRTIPSRLRDEIPSTTWISWSQHLLTFPFPFFRSTLFSWCFFVRCLRLFVWH